MSLTVYEALQLDICKNFQVAAGIKGLSNSIKRVGILDHETGELVYETFTEGQFVLTTLYVIKDDISKLKELVNMMVSVGVSGLAIRSVYFDTIPEDVVRLANDNAFPIMLYNNVYFEDVFAGILSAMRDKDEQRLVEFRIDSLLYGNPDPQLIRKIAAEMNPKLTGSHAVTYGKSSSSEDSATAKSSMGLRLSEPTAALLPYKGGYFILHAFDREDEKRMEALIRDRIDKCFAAPKGFVVGSSTIHTTLLTLREAFWESLHAQRHGQLYQKTPVQFNHIGVDRILLPLLDNEWVVKYYNSLITPIRSYDERNATELLATAVCYVKHNGSIKAAATELRQHENTIRYRLERIESLLTGVCSSDTFYEELAIGIRIYQLKPADL